MTTTPLVGLIGLAWLLSGCSSGPEARNTQGPVAQTTQAVVAAAGPRYMRVRVVYDAGRFQAQHVTWVSGQLKQPRSGQPRSGLQYLARSSGTSAFLGNAPDPRTVHVEVPDQNGRLTSHEAPASGKQHFLINVPAETETVEFQARVPAGAGRTFSATLANQAIGSIDLRSIK
jgi:hypothetical protein